MSGLDWRWKIGEAIERIRSQYDHIGRKTGAPFLAVVYPPEAEIAVLNEWHTQIDALRPDYDVRTVDILEITQKVLDEIGAENIVDSLVDPMPGSDPQAELSQLWAKNIADSIRERFSESTAGKPVVSLERLAALYPAMGPRFLMQTLWDNEQSILEGPVIVLIPGTLKYQRTFSFLNLKDELMYRGDLL